MTKLPRWVAWLIIGAAWAVLLPVGVCCALALPLNLVLIPSWFAAASSLGALARELLDGPRPAPLEAPAATPLVRRSAALDV